MIEDEPALAQLMFFLSHDPEIPDAVKKNVLKQYSQYLLQHGKSNAEQAFFGSGNYAKRQWTHQRKVVYFKYLNRRLAEQEHGLTEDKKTQAEILQEVMPKYMHGEGPGALSINAIMDERHDWNREQGITETVTSEIIDNRELIDEKEASGYLNLSPKTLQAWRSAKKKKQPRYHKLGRRVYYKYSDLDDFITERQEGP